MPSSRRWATCAATTSACSNTRLHGGGWALDTASCGGGAAGACNGLRAVDAAGEEAAVALACGPEGGPCGLSCDGTYACNAAWLRCPDGRQCTLPAGAGAWLRMGEQFSTQSSSSASSFCPDENILAKEEHFMSCGR